MNGGFYIIISVNLTIKVPGQFDGTYEEITFHRALMIINEFLADYGDGVQYIIFNGETGESIEAVDMQRICQPVYNVSDLIELLPYLGRFNKATTLDGYVLWDNT